MEEGKMIEQVNGVMPIIATGFFWGLVALEGACILFLASAKITAIIKSPIRQTKSSPEVTGK